MSTSSRSVVCSVVLMLSSLGYAQTHAISDVSDSVGNLPPSALASTTEVPHFVKHSGVLRSADGKAVRAMVNVRFAIYATPDSEQPLWMEMQNVTPDENGAYSVLLG